MRRRSPAARTRRCYDNLKRAGNGFLELDGANRVEAWTFYTGRWNTEKGVGRGSTIAAVRKAYGKKLRVRVTRSWTYLDLRQTVAGQPRLTSFLGRTKYGDIVTLSVVRVRRNIIRPTQPLTAAGQDVTLRFIDFAPRESVRAEVSAPWLSRPVELPAVRTNRRGAATLTLPRGGDALGQVLSSRPTGTASPVTLTFAVSGVARRATAQIALSPAPGMTYNLPVMSEATPGVLTITNPEPRANYSLTAAWTCLDGSASQATEASLDPIYSETGADTTAVPDVDAIRGGVFNADCTGATSPATYPVTLILSRSRSGPDAGQPGPLETVAQVTVPLSSAEPPDPFGP